MAGRIFYSGLSTETNTFSNIPTTYSSFEETGLYRGSEVMYKPDGTLRDGFEPLARAAASRSMEVVCGIAASAHPAAPVQHHDYLRLRDEILDALKKAMPVDAVFLTLHGAMVSTDCFDCEGDLLEKVREVVGPQVPVGAVLDLHGHLTRRMVSSASILVFLKEYPHIDGNERAEEALQVLLRMLDGEPAPVAAIADAHWLGFFPTVTQPMRGLVDHAIACEKEPGICSISLVHGFPWGDTPDTGAKVLVYAREATQAEAMSQRLLGEWLALRESLGFEMATVPELLSALESPRASPLIVADVSDNPGGGAPADNTAILHALVNAQARDIALGLLIDPLAVKVCHQVGVGGKVRLRIGGKVSEFSSSPVDLDVEVIAVASNTPMRVLDVVEFSMGDTAWVRAQGIDIALGSQRIQTYAPEAFTHLGMELSRYRAIIVKSSTHFRAAFSAVSDEVLLVGTPGALDFDFARLPYNHLKRDVYPRNRPSAESFE